MAGPGYYRLPTRLQKPLGSKDARPAPAKGAGFLPARHRSANTPARASGRGCSARGFAPRRALLPEMLLSCGPTTHPSRSKPSKAVLCHRRVYFFRLINVNRKLLPPPGACETPPARSWAAGEDLRNDKKGPSLENLVLLNLFKPKKDPEGTRTPPAHLAAGGATWMWA